MPRIPGAGWLDWAPSNCFTWRDYCVQLNEKVEQTHMALAEWAMTTAEVCATAEHESLQRHYKRGEELKTAAKMALDARLWEQGVPVRLALKLDERLQDVPRIHKTVLLAYDSVYGQSWVVTPNSATEIQHPIHRMLQCLATHVGTGVRVMLDPICDLDKDTLVIEFSPGDDIRMPDRFLHAMAEKMSQWVSGR